MTARNIILILATISLAACSNSKGKGGGSTRQAPTNISPAAGPSTLAKGRGRGAQNQIAAEQQAALDKAKLDQEQRAIDEKQLAKSDAATADAAKVTVTTSYEPRLGANRSADQLETAPAALAHQAAEQAVVSGVGQTRAAQTGTASSTQRVSTVADLVVSPEAQERLRLTAAPAPVISNGLNGVPAAQNSSDSEIGPGLPATYRHSDVPLATGAVNETGQLFTDNHDDSIMAVLVERMKAQSDAQRALSEEMAAAISHVEMAVENSAINAQVQFRFQDRAINLTLAGILQGGRAAQLQMISNNSEYNFRGQVTCADQGSMCRNAVLTIEQLQEGQVCRRIYIVHRWTKTGIGNGHFTIGNAEYVESLKIHLEDKKIRQAKIAGKAFTGEVVTKNKTLRGFIRLIGNTAHQTKIDLGEIPNDNDSHVPRLGFLGVRSWAVASGPSFIEIAMGKQDLYRKGTGLLKISGLLTKPVPAGISSEQVEFSGQLSDRVDDNITSEEFGALAKSARIIDNDGRGNVTLEIKFYAEYLDRAQGEIRVNFTTLREKVLDFNQLNQIVP